MKQDARAATPRRASANSDPPDAGEVVFVAEETHADLPPW
jgi:hypothetical protein